MMALYEMCLSAGRAAWRRPSVSLPVFITLALGIGLTTSLFAIVDAVLWRPLPIAEPARVAWVETLASGQADGSSPGLLFAWRERARSVQAIAGIRAGNATIEYAEGVERVPGAFVSAAYFDVLGVPAARGRVFDAELDRPGAEAVVVISHRLWQQRYRGEEVVGSTLTFNGATRTVIGVMPPTLDELGEDHAWWAPLALADSQRANTGTTYLDVVARLAPGIDGEAARAELTAIAASIGAAASDGSPRGVRLLPFGTQLTAAHRPTVLLIFGAVIVMLAIACANVATLLLTDGLHRHAEMAVRTALGASRGRLIAQVLLEALAVSLCASVCGVLLAHWLIAALVATLPGEIPRLSLAAIDRAAVLFAISLGVCAALAGAGIPALRGTSVRRGDVLRVRGDVSEVGTVLLRRAFVIGQVALTTALAASGALLLQSTRALERAPRGYEAGVLTSTFVLPGHAFPTATAQASAFETLLTTARAVPGVSRAAIATRVPLAGSGAGSDVVPLDEDFDQRRDQQVRIRLVSPGFFATMGIPVVRGREVESGDGGDGRRVVLVNEALARRLARGDALIGTSVKFALREFNEAGRVTPWEVIGVAADTFDQGPRAAVAPEIFVPLAQAPLDVLGWMGNQALLAVRGAGAGDVSQLTPTLRAAVARAGLRIPLYDVRTTDQRLAAHLARERSVSRVLTILAIGGLSLSGFGVFAVVHHLVRRRRREMALRLALGAAPAALTSLVFREALIMTIAGVTLGFLVFRALSDAVRPLLFGVGSTDPATFVAVAILLACIALAAAVGPARAVGALDPASVLRDE